jgi:hypothetical protein
VRSVILAGVLLVALSAGFAETAMAQAATDACALITPEQVSAVVGAKVGTGTNPAPGFTKTCTWVTKGIIVTLMLETAEAFQKQKAMPLAGMEVTPASGVGDDAFYGALSSNVSLFAKKGSTAFKATVYSSAIPMDKKKDLEKTLAQQVVGKL